MRARGLKQVHRVIECETDKVAPHAGAWIETVLQIMYEVQLDVSRPMRARGLKPLDNHARRTSHRRAPCGRVD